MRSVEFSMAPQKIKFEEELVILQATVDSTTRQNDVCINYTLTYIIVLEFVSFKKWYFFLNRNL